MPKTFLNAGCLALVALLLLGAPLAASAEVTRIDVKRRDDVLGERSFGAAEPYERLVGTVHFAVDPNHPRNTRIVDLDKAPRNRQGRVEFPADIYIIQPSRGNGVLRFGVLNVGRQRLLGRFNDGTASNNPSTEAHFGDGWLLREGYTLVSVGWQFDVPRTQQRLALDAPIAADAGRPISGWVRMWFISNQPVASFEYVAGNNTVAYPPIDLDDERYRLTVRDATPGGTRLIPREQWRFAREVEGRLVPDPNFIWVMGGLQAGQTYKVAYEAQNPPVAGLGLSASRDTASAFKYGDDPLALGRYAYMYGSSQTGRLAPRLLYNGSTIDEQDRKAFDAVMINTGGTVMGSFNEWFAQPNDLGVFMQTKLPFLYRPSVDQVTGREDGLGAQIPLGLEPKILLMDTSSEYWDLGRLSALRHVSMDGSQYVSAAANVRVYHFAGAAHAAGALSPAAGAGQVRTNPLNYDWGHRALLAALDQWVREGREPPPPSQVVPLATFSGWQFRADWGPAHARNACPGPICRSRTGRERERIGDPRPAIEERCTSRSDYLQRVEAAGRRLALERYLLEEDIAAIVEEAGEHWDWLVSQ